MKPYWPDPELLAVLSKLGIKYVSGATYEPGERRQNEWTSESRERFTRFMGCTPEEYAARQKSSRKHPSSKPRRAKSARSSRTPARGRKRKSR